MRVSVWRSIHFGAVRPTALWMGRSIGPMWTTAHRSPLREECGGRVIDPTRERGGQRRVRGEVGVGGDNLDRVGPRIRNELAVGRGRQQAQARASARLCGAQHVALMAQGEVPLRELEAVE